MARFTHRYRLTTAAKRGEIPSLSGDGILLCRSQKRITGVSNASKVDRQHRSAIAFSLASLPLVQRLPLDRDPSRASRTHSLQRHGPDHRYCRNIQRTRQVHRPRVGTEEQSRAPYPVSKFGKGGWWSQDGGAVSQSDDLLGSSSLLGPTPNDTTGEPPLLEKMPCDGCIAVIGPDFGRPPCTHINHRSRNGPTYFRSHRRYLLPDPRRLAYSVFDLGMCNTERTKEF